MYIQFCPGCGWLNEDPSHSSDKTELIMHAPLIASCPECNVDLEFNNTYTIPVYDKETDTTILGTAAQTAQQMFLDFPERYFPVSDNDSMFNIKVDGEWNGVSVGKKIQEKNEQLKRKVSGYEHEQRNVKADVERQIKQKHAQEGI